MVDFNPARGSEQAGHRPALVISSDVGNQHSSVVIVAAITRTIPKKPYPQCVPLPGRPDGPLPQPGTILCSQLMKPEPLDAGTPIGLDQLNEPGDLEHLDSGGGQLGHLTLDDDVLVALRQLTPEHVML